MSAKILYHCKVGNVVSVDIFGSTIIGIVTYDNAIINVETTNVVNLQAETIVTLIAYSVSDLIN